MKSTWRVITGLIVFWLLVLLYMSATLFNTSDVNERTERQLAKALQELDMLRQQNEQLAHLAQDLKDIQMMLNSNDDSEKDVLKKKLEQANGKLQSLHPTSNLVPQVHLPSDGTGPSYEHEYLRRKVQNGVREMWYFIRGQIQGLLEENKQGKANMEKTLHNILNNGADHQRTILTDLYNLSESDGDKAWREQEARDLSAIVQNRLHFLQNPADCSSAKKLVCNMNKGCGYGCQLHHVLYCFVVAYGSKRTLILESKGWRYSPQGWEKVFKPLSDSCLERGGGSSRTWAAAIEDVQVVDMPIVDSLHPRPPFLPQAIPKDLAPRLTRLHGHPFAWWAGQFLKYMLRPSDDLQKEIDETEQKLGFKTPIVGVHVRRTDKVGTEAAFHGIDEYMIYVEEYFQQLAQRQPVTQKSIYLATDEPNLLEETKQKYPDYKVISENQFSRSAGLSSRYSETSLIGIVLDIHFLSRSDYLVCTFSSQVCRVAYEIMQALYPDASDRFKSLDDVYYFGGQQGHNQVALQDHVPQTQNREAELDLRVGDVIGIAGNHWDGYSKGKNSRTNRNGLYPSYKAAEEIRIVDMASYSDADSLLQKKS